MYQESSMIQKGKIEVSNNAIIPNKRELWGAAKDKLSEVSFGLKEIVSARDRISYENGWIRCVDSLEEFWTSFYDEGVQKFTSFQPWAGKIVKEKKEDKLLQYIYQARHQSQHGRVAIEWEEPRTQVAPGYFGHIKDLKINADGSFQVDANPLGKTHNEVKLVFNPENARLPTIENKKFKQTFSPPEKHLNKNIKGIAPQAAVELALTYYKAILTQAENKFTNN